ncbi:transmembrane protein, putative (macronuclear) [Tetrahymena thermophila SB210]|uniref:Transmembrane protein, putative n=1 Tax=Tetrahymena thermophila (strain SB210) TaxID=312017 RepID=W7X6H7_TETTS|nr:transmembrane protein, putative [Tetrahymena thermophila SB210]EWS73017.1 transmembrane protein, putative [Tetrahymena thermophila SB210]|eukprot:XP_012654414.1 transmembrane protein, putative [Tetrahymena thermophila SB210]
MLDRLEIQNAISIILSNHTKSMQIFCDGINIPFHLSHRISRQILSSIKLSYFIIQKYKKSLKTKSLNLRQVIFSQVTLNLVLSSLKRERLRKSIKMEALLMFFKLVVNNVVIVMMFVSKNIINLLMKVELNFLISKNMTANHNFYKEKNKKDSNKEFINNFKDKKNMLINPKQADNIIFI